MSFVSIHQMLHNDIEKGCSTRVLGVINQKKKKKDKNRFKQKCKDKFARFFFFNRKIPRQVYVNFSKAAIRHVGREQRRQVKCQRCLT